MTHFSRREEPMLPFKFIVGFNVNSWIFVQYLDSLDAGVELQLLFLYFRVRHTIILTLWPLDY